MVNMDKKGFLRKLLSAKQESKALLRLLLSFFSNLLHLVLSSSKLKEAIDAL
jgi:hypothetical protein